MVNTFTNTQLSAGGFAGADFAANTPHVIDNGAEAIEAIATVSGQSGPFTTAVATAAGQAYTLTVGGVQVFTFTSVNAGDEVTAAAVQGGIVAATGALNGAGITFTGSAETGNLEFSKADGTDFTIVVANSFTGGSLGAGGFAGADFAANTPHAIDNGDEEIEAVATVSGQSGPFTTAVATEIGQTYSLTVGGVLVFTFLSENAGDEVTAAAVQGGITTNAGTLNGAGITFTGSAEAGDLEFSKADGTNFDIVVVNSFSGGSLGAGGFAGPDFAANEAQLIDRGAEEIEAVATVSGLSGPFTTAVATEIGQTYSLTVGGVLLFSFEAVAVGQTVTATDIQGGITTNAAALSAAGIEFTGSAEAGDLEFSKADGTNFDIVVVNSFSGGSLEAGGFAGADFANGTQSINNGAVAVPTTSTESGVFTTATAIEVGQTYSLTVGGVLLFSFEAVAVGQTVTATDIQGGITTNAAALSAAGIEFTGSAETGDLVFTKADGTDFEIVVTSDFTDSSNSAGGFAGTDFAVGAQLIENGTVAVDAVPTVSDPSGAFLTATAVEAGQTYTLTVGGIEVFTFTSISAGDTVTADDIQSALDDPNVQADLAVVGITASGTVAGGDLVFSKADGTDFDIVVINTFTEASNLPGGFAGADFAGGSVPIDNGAVLGINASGLSGAFESGMAGAAGETFALSVAGVTIFSFTSLAAEDLVLAEDIQNALDNPGIQADLAEAGITVSGTVAGGDLVFTREDGSAFDIVVINEFTGTISLTGGFAGADFIVGTQTIDNGTVAGPAPALSSASVQQAISSGSYSVQSNGEVTLVLTIGDDIITGSGAVTQDGDFIALATTINSGESQRRGRGMLILVRRP